MRILGTIDGKSSAETLVAHLLTRNISTHVEASENNADRWEIWVRDEDRMNDARAELKSTCRTPRTQPTDSFRQAQQIIRDQAKKRLEAQKNYRPVRTLLRTDPVWVPDNRSIDPLFDRFTSHRLFVGFYQKQVRQYHPRTIAVRRHESTRNGRPSGKYPSRGSLEDRTPIFLHGSALHLIFNMIMLIQLGRILENREGPFVSASISW